MSALSGARSYTMRELNQNTSRVMGEIAETGEPALLTRHGRPVAAIIPIPDDRSTAITAKVLAAFIAEWQAGPAGIPGEER